THDVALDTDKIAKLVVSDADAKEFIGKNEVKAKTMDKHQTASSTTTPKTTSTKEETPKPVSQSKPSKQIEPIKASKDNDDEWASF
ncbi:MAG: hypothetical protein K8R39_11930, partial [Arcobacteraceae bacterium]|nr:hypothetical protein [Arcobacteraceae bacterium]